MKYIINKLSEITMEDVKAGVAALILIAAGCFDAWLFA